ncbi:putative F-box protein At1g47730 [Solanum tuberosum]|uniref:putative F-box protein At1g47730 n=1 Tax=Solanum tuberosum TaxID=4113 RepID=UPI000739FEDD|nr:PREDICTED: putative F-box protein At1g47730 [Solanum tuberosum]
MMNISIPEEIIFEIFTWLPVESLLRFKCITKICKSLVSESVFVNIHTCRSMSRPGGTKFFLRGRESIFCTVGQREDEKDSAPFLQIARFNDLDVHVLAYSQMNCINGLFCIWDPLSIRPAAIFNPSTREVRFLPNIKEEFCPCNYSLGFEPEEKKFKVFCSTYERNKQRQCVFTLGIDKSWRETQSISFSIPYSKPSVCVSGVIYQFIDGGAIAAIDVKSEKSETIALWNALRESMYYYELIEVNGKLMVIDYRQWSSHDIQVVVDRQINSATVDARLLETVGCFFDFEDIRDSSSLITKPPFDSSGKFTVMVQLFGNPRAEREIAF